MISLLIVDDEPMIRKGIKTLVDFDALNISTIYEAENGLEALEIVKNNKIDLILADINMPKMNGLDFVLQAKQLSPSTRVAMITGYDHLDYAITALKVGVDDYVLKPVSKVDIVAILHKLIAKFVEVNQEKEALTIAKEMNGDFQNDSSMKKTLSEYVNKHLADTTFSLQELADETGYNTSYLSQLFKKLFGVNFRDHLLHLRLEKCKILLLTTNLKIYEIAQQIGIEDSNYLSACFKRVYGLSISEFKDQQERK
ncbi:response regulator transcription factor [Anaerorhabdus sp.]|uniref:response regulator transcription factor n=1 Tax=Anaerorhabdus sp. TaxID=1872524 RepID=UPI002B207D1A|nr:response regulator [Anaerorhabdus sp.]MEA4876260.1 response regulator [Anaerorhabdus sp.]